MQGNHRWLYKCKNKNQGYEQGNKKCVSNHMHWLDFLCLSGVFVNTCHWLNNKSIFQHVTLRLKLFLLEDSQKMLTDAEERCRQGKTKRKKRKRVTIWNMIYLNVSDLTVYWIENYCRVYYSEPMTCSQYVSYNVTVWHPLWQFPLFTIF